MSARQFSPDKATEPLRGSVVTMPAAAVLGSVPFGGKRSYPIEMFTSRRCGVSAKDDMAFDVLCRSDALQVGKIVVLDVPVAVVDVPPSRDRAVRASPDAPSLVASGGRVHTTSSYRNASAATQPRRVHRR